MALDFEFLRREYEEAKGSIESEFWVPKTGENRVRILPPSPKEKTKLFYRKVFVHYGVEGLGLVFCLKNWNEKCPVCEFVDKLRQIGSIEATNLAKRILPKERYLMNVLPLDSVDSFGIVKVKQWLAPKTVRLELLKIILDEDWGDITDLDEGRDIVVDRSEKPGSRFVDYVIRPKPDKRKVKINEEIPTFDEILERRKRSYAEIRLKMFGEEEVEEENEVEAYFKRMQEREDNGGKKRDEIIDKEEEVIDKVEKVKDDKVKSSETKEEQVNKALEILKKVLAETEGK